MKLISKIQPLTFKQAVKQAFETRRKELEYVETTGNCCSCEKRKAEKDSAHCKECNEEIEIIINQLQRKPITSFREVGNECPNSFYGYNRRSFGSRR